MIVWASMETMQMAADIARLAVNTIKMLAVDGEVLSHFVEDNPEDWSAYDR